MPIFSALASSGEEDPIPTAPGFDVLDEDEFGQGMAGKPPPRLSLANRKQKLPMRGNQGAPLL